MKEKRMCKYCQHCKNAGRQQTQRMRLGRKTYYCEHEEAYKLPIKAFGNKAQRFICFGNYNTLESEPEIKTTPRWCPMKEGKE